MLGVPEISSARPTPVRTPLNCRKVKSKFKIRVFVDKIPGFSLGFPPGFSVKKLSSQLQKSQVNINSLLAAVQYSAKAIGIV